MLVFGTDLPEKVGPFISQLLDKSFKPLRVAVVCSVFRRAKDILEDKYSRDLDWRADIDLLSVKYAIHQIDAVPYSRIIHRSDRYDVIIVVKQGMSDSDFNVFHGMANDPELTKLRYAARLPQPGETIDYAIKEMRRNAHPFVEIGDKVQFRCPPSEERPLKIQKHSIAHTFKVEESRTVSNRMTRLWRACIEATAAFKRRLAERKAARLAKRFASQDFHFTITKPIDPLTGK
jgi:hypothetical protein